MSVGLTSCSDVLYHLTMQNLCRPSKVSRTLKPTLGESLPLRHIDYVADWLYYVSVKTDGTQVSLHSTTSTNGVQGADIKPG